MFTRIKQWFSRKRHDIDQELMDQLSIPMLIIQLRHGESYISANVPPNMTNEQQMEFAGMVCKLSDGQLYNVIREAIKLEADGGNKPAEFLYNILGEVDRELEQSVPVVDPMAAFQFGEDEQ